MFKILYFLPLRTLLYRIHRLCELLCWFSKTHWTNTLLIINSPCISRERFPWGTQKLFLQSLSHWRRQARLNVQKLVKALTYLFLAGKIIAKINQPWLFICFFIKIFLPFSVCFKHSCCQTGKPCFFKPTMQYLFTYVSTPGRLCIYLHPH